MSLERFGADRLTSLRAADAEDVAPGRGPPEVVIEADGAVDLRAREIQRMRDGRDRFGGDPSELVLNRVKDR